MKNNRFAMLLEQFSFIVDLTDFGAKRLCGNTIAFSIYVFFYIFDH